jgi:hypothetical protein
MALRELTSSIAAGLALGLSLAGPSYAALGGDVASVSMDTARLRGVVHATALQAYQIHEITTDTGIRVREWLAAGRVFAVTWSGPVEPDLPTLLGAHFDRFARALSALPPGLHKSLRIQAADLVVESGGHLRAYGGRAYLTSAVPAGMAAAQIR